MRSSLLTGLTTRGTSFLTAGAATVLAGLLLGSRALISVGVALIVLPMLARLAAGRARYRLSCTRSVNPVRVPAGTTATVTLRLENTSRLPTGLMLAEDGIPYALGTRPRYVLDGIERGGVRELRYPLRSDLRGKFDIGPLEIRIADSFGVVELGRKFSSRTKLVVTPRVVPLTRAAASSSWAGDGDGMTRTTAAAGEDDVIPRAYRNGDELRRVHWRSTARYGQLMVRREEQRWQDRAVLILDTRRSAHAGSGPSSSFEFAVSAVASIGVHLARSGLDGHLLTDSGPLAGSSMFEDVLLDALSVVDQSRNHDFARTTAALGTIEGGLLVLVAGRLSVEAAREIAASRREGRQGIALLLAVSTWAGQPGRSEQSANSGGPAQNGQNGHSDPDDSDQNGNSAPSAAAQAAAQAQSARAMAIAETAKAEAVLRAAGWRVTTVDATTPLAVAWQHLPRAGSFSAQGGELPSLGVVT
jgi:uncharacterized protein (DUF58 family)